MDSHGTVAKRPPADARDLGFEGSLEAVQDQVGAVSAIAREESELKGQIVVAKRFPRNEAAAAAKLIKSCGRPTFAEGALYSFPRGGAKVEGPSVSMAREAARVWGNIRYGLRLVSLDEEQVHIKGFCLDLETNNYVEAEDKFARLIFRKRGGWVRPDERDLRELVNRRGAICVRNAILQVLPPDVVEEAMLSVRETIRKAARGDIQQDAAAAIRRLVIAFDQVGVSADMLEKKIEHALDLITESELVELRKVWAAINDGVAKREEYFDLGAGRPERETAKVKLGDVKPAKDQPEQESPTSPPPADRTTPAAQPPSQEAEPSNASAGDEQLFT